MKNVTSVGEEKTLEIYAEGWRAINFLLGIRQDPYGMPVLRVLGFRARVLRACQFSNQAPYSLPKTMW